MAGNPASSRQLSYLRRLADQTGQTFTYPTTSREASAEIDRLKNTPRAVLLRAPGRTRA